MSPTDTGIIVSPEQLVAEENGIRRWRPIFDAITVDQRPSGGKLIRIIVNDEILASFDLSLQDARHLASLLCDDANAEKPAPSV